MKDIGENKPANILNFIPSSRVNNTDLSQAQRIINDNKRSIFAEWLSQGTVSVLLDARKPGVKVPVDFARQGDLRLNFCHKFHIPDFNFNENGVWASLSFDKGEFFCLVPWNSIYGIQSAVLQQGAVWFEDFPSDYDQEEVLGISEQTCEYMQQNYSSLSDLTTQKEATNPQALINQEVLLNRPSLDNSEDLLGQEELDNNILVVDFAKK